MSLQDLFRNLVSQGISTEKIVEAMKSIADNKDTNKSKVKKARTSGVDHAEEATTVEHAETSDAETSTAEHAETFDAEESQTEPADAKRSPGPGNLSSDNEEDSNSDSSAESDEEDDDEPKSRSRGRGNKKKIQEARVADTPNGDELKGTDSKSLEQQVSVETKEIPKEKIVSSKKTSKKDDTRRCIGRKPVTDFEVGKSYDGTVVYVKPFGAFIDIRCHSDAFVHVSRVDDGFVEDINSVLKGKSCLGWVSVENMVAP